MQKIIALLALGLIVSGCQNQSPHGNTSDAPLKNALPEGFIHLNQAIPNLHIEARYFSENNFMGVKVDHYHSSQLILSKPAAMALSKVQNELKKQNLELKVFDAYRPQGAVDHFVRWAENLNDTTMKGEYYPEVQKSQLFEKGYIAAKSGHSRGSTVDLTIIHGSNKQEMDMGTPFDFFSTRSWPSDTTISKDQFANRMFLQSVMEKNGFKHLKEEWWHFTLRNEPYPDTYFEFDVN
jgi:D-alanyl-D-alanine dipeptidase